MTSKVGFHKISLRRGDVNALYTLECAHRRQLLAARALNERSLPIRGLSVPRTKTIGDVYIDDLAILSVLQFSDVHVASLPIEVRRADALYDFFQMPTNAGKSGRESSGEDTSKASQALYDAGCCSWGKADDTSPDGAGGRLARPVRFG